MSESPSSLQRALRWSIPGAALLSIPATLLLGKLWLRIPIIQPVFGGYIWLILAGVALLAMITAGTSVKAIYWSCDASEANPLFIIALILFNLAALVDAFAVGYLLFQIVAD